MSYAANPGRTRRKLAKLIFELCKVVVDPGMISVDRVRRTDGARWDCEGRFAFDGRTIPVHVFSFCTMGSIVRGGAEFSQDHWDFELSCKDTALHAATCAR